MLKSEGGGLLVDPSPPLIITTSEGDIFGFFVVVLEVSPTVLWAVGYKPVVDPSSPGTIVVLEALDLVVKDSEGGPFFM